MNRSDSISWFPPNVTLLMSSFVSYCIFHKYEPAKTLHLAVLLLLVPTAVSLLHSLRATMVIFIFITYWFLLLLYTFVYRVSPFHPLAKYPGPFIHKVTKFQLVWQVWNGEMHREFRELHQKYGDVVRIGPNEISYCNVDSVTSILNTLPKGSYYSNRQPVPSILNMIDPVAHIQRRKPWNRSFSGPSLKDYDQVIVNRARELVDELQKRSVKPIDISKWMNYFSFDFMGDMAFNFSFDSMKEGSDKYGYMAGLESTIKSLALTSHVPWARKFTSYYSKGTGLAVYRMSQKLVEHRIKTGSTTKDLIYHLSNEDGKQANGPVPTQLFSDGMTAIIAGSDTTSIVLANVWYYLLRTPACYSRLREELDVTFPGGEEPIDQERLANMPYLNACINEAMRLQPPVPSSSQRVTVSGGSMIGSNFVPAGTNVAIHTYTLQRDPRYFSPYSDAYWPDRWLGPDDRMTLEDMKNPLDPGVDVITNKSAFVPFSSGARNCVGKNMAMNEMRVVISLIVRRFDMKVAAGYNLDDWEASLKDAFVIKKSGPLPVVLVKQAW